jgi:prepilin-type N-terminal cleavage/methylation domain-containing protein
MRRDPAQDDGFTLVEVLVVLMLLGVVSTMIMSITIGATRAAVVRRTRRGPSTQSKVAMERMTRDIRGATRWPSPGTTGSPWSPRTTGSGGR